MEPVRDGQAEHKKVTLTYNSCLPMKLNGRHLLVLFRGLVKLTCMCILVLPVSFTKLNWRKASTL